MQYIIGIFFFLFYIVVNYVKVKVDHHLNKLCRAHTPNATYQNPRLLALFLGTCFLKVFILPYICVTCDLDNLKKLLSPFPSHVPKFDSIPDINQSARPS